MIFQKCSISFNIMITQKRIYDIFIFLLLSISCNMQLMSNPLIDSLILEVNKTQDFNKQAKLYKAIGDKFFAIHQDSTTKYYNKSLEAAFQTESHLDEIITLRSFAHYFGNWKADYAKANNYLLQALKIAEKENDFAQLAIIKNGQGIMSKKEGNFQKSIDSFFGAYRIIQTQTDNDDIKMKILLSLGVIHNETSYNKKAKEYYQEALQLADKNGHYKMKGVLLNNLGKVGRDLENFKESYQYYNNALSIFDSLNNDYWKGLIYYNFGYNHFLQKEYLEAINFYNKSINLNKRIKDKDREVMLLSSMAEVNEAIQKKHKAIDLSLQGLELLKQIKTKEYYPTFHSILGRCYQSLGQFKKANFHLEQHITTKQQRDEEGLSSEIGQIQAMHENELKIAAVNQLKIKVASEKIKRQKTNLLFRLLLISFIFALTFIGLLSYRNKLKQSEKNHELRNQLSRDLHDNIGGSLNRIKILLGRFNRKSNHESRDLTTIQNLSNDVITNMYDLIWSLDREKEKVNDLLEYMRDHASNVFSPLEIPLTLKINSDQGENIVSAEVKNNIFNIYKEAINNIIKHTHPKEVFITITVNNNVLDMFIKNDKTELTEIKTSSNNGLLNMKKRASLINGTLDIDNQRDYFIISLKVKLPA